MNALTDNDITQVITFHPLKKSLDYFLAFAEIKMNEIVGLVSIF